MSDAHAGRTADRTDVLHGTLALMLLKTLAALGPLHGYGIARRIEQTSGHPLLLNHGTVYPALLRLEQLGWIRSKWTTSENNRRARDYSITRPGHRQPRSARHRRCSRSFTLWFSSRCRFPRPNGWCSFPSSVAIPAGQ